MEQQRLMAQDQVKVMQDRQSSMMKQQQSQMEIMLKQIQAQMETEMRMKSDLVSQNFPLFKIFIILQLNICLVLHNNWRIKQTCPMLSNILREKVGQLKLPKKFKMLQKHV